MALTEKDKTWILSTCFIVFLFNVFSTMLIFEYAPKYNGLVSGHWEEWDCTNVTVCMPISYDTVMEIPCYINSSGIIEYCSFCRTELKCKQVWVKDV